MFQKMQAESGATTRVACRSMAVTAEQITEKLKAELKTSEVTVEDTSGGCGASFSVAVASPLFQGKSLIQRHRAINTALKEEIPQIHALSIAKCDVIDQASGDAKS